MQIVPFKEYFNGIASNPYYVDQQVVDTQGLEFMTSLPSVRTHPQGTSVYSGASVKKMICWADNFLFCEDGEVYNTAGTKVHTMTDTKDIKSAMRFRDYYVWMYANFLNNPQIAYIAKSNTDSGTRSTWSNYDETRNPTWWSVIEDADCFCPMLVFYEDLYIGNKTQVLKISWVEWSEITEVWLENLSSDVKWLSQEWSRIVVYLENGTKLFRDWSSEQVQEAKQFNIDIRATYDLGDYDVVIAGDTAQTSVMYLSAWYEMTKIGTNKINILASKNITSAMWWCWQYDGQFYLPWFLTVASWAGIDWDNDNACVYSYGSSVSGIQWWRNAPIVKNDAWNGVRRMTGIHMYKSRLYYWRDDVTNSSIGVSEVDLKPTTWQNGVQLFGTWWSGSKHFMVYAVYDGWSNDRTKQKSIKAVQVVWSLANANTAFTIKYRKVDSFAKANRKWLQDYWYNTDWFTTLTTINNDDFDAKQEKYEKAVDIWWFYAIQFMVVFEDPDVSLTQLNIVLDNERPWSR